MEIQCPPSKEYVLVSGQGSGSGSGSGSGGGTICVRGIVTDQDTGGLGLPTLIRVCVVSDWVAPPPPSPEPPPAGSVTFPPGGQNWCAQGVPVPDSSPTGVKCTAVAWFKTGSTDWSEPTSVWFYAGGPNPVDCCVGCESEGVAPDATSSAFQSWPPPPPPLPPNLTSGPN